jgi:mRNA-degrading endonuclease RelE of RelBE toxin-antitoxin system
VDRRTVILAPKAQRDLSGLPRRDAEIVVKDLELLQAPPWSPGKVRKLRGLDYREIKTGDYRSIFLQEGKKVIVLRIINRRDLFRTIKHIDITAIVRWLKEKHEK